VRLRFLGTAAAEGYPGIYCECENCTEARRRGGPNLRRRTALLVNDDLLVDFGPDVANAAAAYGLHLSRLEYLLITHGHEDHFLRSNFAMRGRGFRRDTELPLLHVFGAAALADRIADLLADPDNYRVAYHAVAPGDRFEAGGYKCEAFPAAHDPGASPQLYAVGDDRTRFFYSLDTGPLPEATWSAISGREYDAIILEETMGTASSTGHLGLDDFLATKARFEKEQVIKPGGRFIATHFSHQCNPAHDELSEILAAHGVTAAYDGMVVDI
jgi:phosphoribosyl 1,2-cyclic phosphate phosphodiesterase